MNYSKLYENKKHGTFDFPIALYVVDKNAPNYQMPFHWHIEYEIIFVKKGRFEVSFDGKNYLMNEGDCAWVGEGIVHGGEPFDCKYECVDFDLGTLMQNSPVCLKSTTEFVADASGFTGVFRSGSVQAEIAEKIFESMNSEETGYQLTTVGLLWQFMGSLLSLKKNDNFVSKNKNQILRLKNVLTYIRDNYENSVSLSELAEVAGMVPRYFCRAFSGMTGKTPIDYLNYYRVEQACELLVLTDSSVTDIALNCGFNDMSYFSKTFAKYKNVSPSSYRKNNYSNNIKNK